MNILPKKKWHVRTKENMARVRRDEAKATAEEAAVRKRATLADHEDRVRRLKSKAASSYGPSVFDRPTTSLAEDGGRTAASNTGHVNFFEELETQERQNLHQGNKEYEAEKKKEYNDWESKMGIMNRFAENTKEYSKNKYWWECIPLVRKDITDGFTNNFAKNIVPSDPQQKLAKSTDVAPKVAPIMKHRICGHVGADSSQLPKPKRVKSAEEDTLAGLNPKTIKVLMKKAKKKLREEKHIERKKQKKERRQQRLEQQQRRRNGKADSDLDTSSGCEVIAMPSVKAKKRKSKKAESSGKNDGLSQLRAERLKREKAEKERSKTLFQPKGKATAATKTDLDLERNRKYNTQFNPEFAKR